MGRIASGMGQSSGRIAGSELFIFDDLLNPVFVSHKFKNKQGLTTTQNDHTGYMVYEINPPSNDVICS